MAGFFCAQLTNAAFADAIPGSGFQSGNWSGAAYSLEDGSFSHCVISTEYQSDDTLFFSVTNEATVVVGVASYRLGMQPGAEYAVSVTIDRRYNSQRIATAIDEQYFILELPDFGRAMDAIRFGNTLFVQGDGFRGEYRLTGTAVALERARLCALTYINYGSPSNSAPEVADTSIDRTYLFQAATQMIAALGLSDFRYFTEAEMREAGVSVNDVFWYSEMAGLMGGVYITPREGRSLRELDASDTQFLAGFCDGDFASSARDLDGFTVPAREVRLLCAAEDEPHEVFLTKIQAGDFVLYSELRYFDGAALSDTPRTRSADSEIVAARLASFVVE